MEATLLAICIIILLSMNGCNLEMWNRGAEEEGDNHRRIFKRLERATKDSCKFILRKLFICPKRV